MKIRKIKLMAAILFLTAAFVCLAPADAAAQILKPGEIIYSRVPTVPDGNCATAAIWVVGQDGSNDRFITFGLHPRISPDGRRILFKRFDPNTLCSPFFNGQPEWWIRDLATRQETQIALNVGIAFGHFFSPETNRADKQIITDDVNALCTMKLDGTNRICTGIPALDPIRGAGHMSVRGGDNLVVVQNYYSNDQPASGLYTLNYNDLLNRQKIPNTNYGDLNPSWSNDGQTIAYATTDTGSRGVAGPFINLFTIKPDGTNKTQLTSLNPPPGEGFGYSLVWTLDNSTILNAAKINGVAGIYKISASGGGILGTIPITPGAAPEWVGGIAPAYSEQQVASFGGGVTSGGNYSLVDTIGQAFAGQTSTGGSYNLQSGFWANLPTHSTPFDFDGDSKTDIGIFRPGPAEWWINRSSTGLTFAAQFGLTSDKLTPVDYTGDGKADIAFFRPSTGQWFILRSEDSSFFAFPFGANGDIPAPADFDGDGKADAAVFRPSSATWFVQRSSDNGVTAVAFGISSDQPVANDFDGDGKADFGVWRSGPGEWWILKSTGGVMALQFGSSTDKAVPGDYTGDGKADVAFFRPSTGTWFVVRSEDLSFFAFPFGAGTDLPAPGDYDGDGKIDAAVFRPSNQNWFVNKSSGGVTIVTFGAPGDLPVPGAFVR